MFPAQIGDIDNAKKKKKMNKNYAIQLLCIYIPTHTIAVYILYAVFLFKLPLSVSGEFR